MVCFAAFHNIICARCFNEGWIVSTSGISFHLKQEQSTAKSRFWETINLLASFNKVNEGEKVTSRIGNGFESFSRCVYSFLGIAADVTIAFVSRVCSSMLVNLTWFSFLTENSRETKITVSLFSRRCGQCVKVSFSGLGFSLEGLPTHIYLPFISKRHGCCLAFRSVSRSRSCQSGGHLLEAAFVLCWISVVFLLILPWPLYALLETLLL